MEALIYWVIVGGLAGWLASIVTGTNQRMGCLLNIAVGVVGAIIGGWVFRNLGLGKTRGTWVGTIVVAFVGATILLALVRLFSRRY
jgi:uncharacterized membrane protein YeaQ/YmgE (transglycosylase-associated protein family)